MNSVDNKSHKNKSCENKSAQYYICVTALSFTDREQLKKEYLNASAQNTTLTLQLSIPYSDVNQKTHDTVLLKTPYENTVYQFRVDPDEGANEQSIKLLMEDVMDINEISPQLQAEFVVGDITLAFEDYLNLEAGDALEIDSGEIPLKGILQVGGVPVATGMVRVKDQMLEIQLKK